ncbi:MAG TPA: VWA domain-containing protein [Vicinamibacteria bacterium]|nr:VWA domain-containing protein [Vicinamibacteria bacterium]
MEEPHWLLLLAALAFTAWYWPRPRLRRPLRFASMVLCVLVLTRPYLRDRGDAIDLWLLLDHSASAHELVQPREDEIVSLLERSKSRNDRVLIVEFADEVRLRGRSDGEPLSDLGERTRLASAITFALSSEDSGRNRRLLIVTDGYSTEPLGALEERIGREGVPLDLRLVSADERADFAVESIELPTRGRPHEPFAIDVRLRGTIDGEAPYTFLRNGEKQVEASASIVDGEARLHFSDRLAGREGAVEYEIRLDSNDAYPGNNRATAFIEIETGPRLVLVTAYAADPLGTSLREQGFEVDEVTEASRLRLGRLAGARAVVVNNVPAAEVSDEFLEALDAFVRVQGGGLLMVGGRHSFGSGGYFGSPVDELLPVSMELREEHRTLSVAMAIVMDRSGSMSAGVDGGRTKMDLANEGAARSIELLGPHDSVAVFAVDSAPHEIVPLTPLRNGAGAIVDKVRRINSTGGGIYVYEGLSAAWKTLERSAQGQRHVILFSDAADSEEPGNYAVLLEEMVRGGVTVSVIGLGTEADADASLLRDIARRGQGRIFFNADPSTLPALFAQETVAVARSAFLEETVGLRATAGIYEVASEPISGLRAVDAYNLSYLREDAAAAAVTTDEYEAPLVALWSRGSGRVAAVSFPLGGELSGTVRRWPGYGDFVQTLGRWLMGDDVPPGMGVETKLDGTTLSIDLWFDESWEERLARESPEVLLVRSTRRDIEPLVWERLEPGHFRATRDLESGDNIRGAVRASGAVIPFGPIAAPGGAEWDFDARRLAELRALSRSSGGADRTELTSMWDDRLDGGRLDLRPALLWVLLGMVLLEALASRIGWRRAEMGAWRARRTMPKPSADPGSAREEKHLEPRPGGEPSLPEPAVAVAPDATEQRRRRFARAKRGR